MHPGPRLVISFCLSFCLLIYAVVTGAFGDTEDDTYPQQIDE